MRGVELSSEDREIISRELAKGESYRAVGRLPGRDHSVVSREVARNGGREKYRAMHAQCRADVCRSRPKTRVLESNTRLHDAVNEGLGKKWSPRQVSERLRIEFSDDDTMRVSYETICQTLYPQARGEPRTQLKLALRQGRARRVSRSRASVARGGSRTWSTSASGRLRPRIGRSPVSGRVTVRRGKPHKMSGHTVWRID